MRVWRLARRAHGALDGEGARQWGGRWNSPGRPVVYCSRLLSLAALEYLVHLNPMLAPEDLTAFALDLPDDVGERLAEAELPAGWGRRVAATREIGDRWLAAGRSPLLIVPSAVLPAALVPEEVNVLINPAHPDAGALQVAEVRAFSFDPRLLTRR